MSLWLHLILLPLLAVPEIAVQWANRSEATVNIALSGDGEFVEPCLKAGLQVEYRFQLQACRYRGLWMDDCEEERVLIHRLSLDPVSRKYTFAADLLRDEEPPVEENLQSLKEATARMQQIELFPLRVLHESKRFGNPTPEQYLNVKVTGWCEGEFNRTLARISSFLTLGIFRSTEFETGWLEFDLR
jgi:hypothetical protein